jgi:hypothetical protein
MPVANTSTATTAKQGLKNGTSLSGVESLQKASTARFKEHVAQVEASTEKLQEVRSQWQQALQTGDIDKLSILNASYETLSRENAKNSKDVATMMGALAEGYKDIGLVMKSTEAFDASEQKIVDDANNLVETKKGDLVYAQGMFNFMGRRDRAIAAAKSDIKTAEAAVTTARQDAELRRRTRLGSMNLEGSMQLQRNMTAELVEIAKSRISTIQSDLESVKQNGNETMDQIKVDAKAVEDFDATLKQQNGEINTMEEELTSYTENSSEWQECRGRIRDKTRERDETETERNKAFSRSQEGQKFIEFNKIEEQAHLQLLAQHQTWIEILQFGAKQRDILYQSHLNLIKGASEQQGMSMAATLGVATDERFAVDAAQQTAAMRRGMLDYQKAMPDNVRRMRDITKTDVEGQLAFEDEMNKLIEDFHKNFGTAAGYDNRDVQRQAQPTA